MQDNNKLLGQLGTHLLSQKPSTNLSEIPWQQAGNKQIWWQVVKGNIGTSLMHVCYKVCVFTSEEEVNAHACLSMWHKSNILYVFSFHIIGLLCFRESNFRFSVFYLSRLLWNESNYLNQICWWSVDLIFTVRVFLP